MDKDQIKATNKVLVVTPATALILFNKGIIDTKQQFFSMVLDKIDAHQAFDLDQDLLELAKTKQYNIDKI